MKKIFPLMMALLGCSFPLHANLPLPSGTNQEVVVHNCVLANIMGEVITLLDVTKRMDIYFYQQFPQLASSMEARYQFYEVNWPTMLDAMINDTLILADAKEKEIEITDGELREEMERVFGPDVVVNIDTMGLTLKEAREVLRKDLIVRRMNGMMVTSRARMMISPKQIRQRYEERLVANPASDTWVYRMITFRGDDERKRQSVAEAAFALLEEGGHETADLPALLDERGLLEEGVFVRVSDRFERLDEEISLAHKAILQTIAVAGHTFPMMQQSSGKQVSRIFSLEERRRAVPPTLREVQQEIRRELVQERVMEERENYLKRLRDHFNVEGELKSFLPEEFQPFSLS